MGISTLDRIQAESEARGKHQSIIQILDSRIGEVPEGLCEAIEAVTDEAKLDEMIRTAATAKTLEDFSKTL